MLARDFIVVLMLFGLFSGVGYLIVEDISSSERGYDVVNMSDENYRARYDTLLDTTDNVKQMQTAASSKEGLTIWSVFTTMFSATFTVIGLVFGSIGTAILTVKNFGLDLGMSEKLINVVAGAILTILTSLIVFIVISSISRGRL